MFIYQNLTDEQIKEIKKHIEDDTFGRAFVTLGEPKVEIIPIYQERAIAILRLLVSNPAYVDDFLDDKCLYCYEWQHEPHAPDCPYLLAQQLLEEIDNGRPPTEIP